MATNSDNNEDDSFIILGTSPGTSMDLKCNGVEIGDVFDKEQMNDALKDLPTEASMAFKAHFLLRDNPSPASLAVASCVVGEAGGEQPRRRFAQLLDENALLKETLRQNNDSMKEQLRLFASCHDDMLRTHRAHGERWQETRQLVQRLRRENEQLRREGGAGEGPPHHRPGDELGAQLALLEAQRRQVIVDNEKLTWQKESLEHIVDAASRERDELKEKLKKVELQLCTSEAEHAAHLNKLHLVVQDLQSRLKSASENQTLSGDIAARDEAIETLEGKLAALRSELKMSQVKILDMENIKLEFTRHKSGVADMVKMYRGQIQELSTRLKHAQRTELRPAEAALGGDGSADGKLYDRTLKHLAHFLNSLTDGVSDSLVQTLGIVASLHDFKLERGTADKVGDGLAELKLQLETQHTHLLNNIGKLRGIVSIFEGIFKDRTETLREATTQPENVVALSAALVARGDELKQLRAELQRLRAPQQDTELLQAQLQVYKSDFVAEREARERMASEKEDAMAQCRAAEARARLLATQLEEVRRASPGACASGTAVAQASPRARTPTTGNMVYTCPKCLSFSSDQYKVMEDHFDYCLEDF